MAYNKTIKIDENGPKIYSNGSTIFSDVSLSLKDFAPTVNSWNSSTQILNKGESIIINDKWDFVYIRLRWLDKPNNGTDDGALSIYEACSSISLTSNASACGCSTTNEPTLSSKTAFVSSLATLEVTQYTEYLLSENFAYLTSGATSILAGMQDLYDHSFNAVISNDILYFYGATAGPTGATANPYPINQEYYSYTNQDKSILLVYDIHNTNWRLISTSTNLNNVTGTENIQITILNSAIWSTISHQLGNSLSFLPQLSNSNGSFKITESIDLEDLNMPVNFKFSELFTYTAHKFKFKITSDLNNQAINILIGK